MPIDLALLGCGHPALADVLGVVATEPDVRLAAVWDSDRAIVPPAIRDFAVADAETAIARAGAVVIGAPPAERPVLCARAARAGRPALVQVPLAPSAAEARGLRRELDRHRTPVLAALPLRELAALHRLQATVRAGVTGRISGVDAALTRTPVRIATRSASGERLRRARPRGFVELSVHVLDALALLGETPRLEAVSLDGRRGGGDRGGAALGRWGAAPLVVRASLDAPRAELRLSLQGSRASAELTDGVLELRDETGRADRWVGGPPDAGEPVRAFLDRLRRRRFPDDALAGPVRAQLVAERAQPLA